MQTQTVFSHVIQKRFSKHNEDVATDALAFILHSSESARNGMMKLIHGIDPSMPTLRFLTQQTEGGKRPDMWGYAEGKPRVFIENKFWAGLTENQPVMYLEKLVKYTQPTVLLVVGPENRVQRLWHDLNLKLDNAGISETNKIAATGIVHCIKTEIGPILALTSWTRLLSALELEVADDQSARSDLRQLRALCEAADSDAFIPIKLEEVSEQRTPAFILQLSSIVQTSMHRAVDDGVLHIGRLQVSRNWDRIGQYAQFFDEKGIGTWFGIDFGLWRKHGTPLWLLFEQGKWGRALEVQPLLEQWANKEKERVFTVFQNDEFAVPVDIAFGEDKDEVVRNVVDRLKRIADALQVLSPKR